MTENKDRFPTDAEERAHFGEQPMPMRFGRWTFDPEAQTLDHEEGYWIPLSEMNNSTTMLDWIFQIAAKSWASAEDLGQLLVAIREIFDPQANICSMGIDRPFNAGEWLSRRFPMVDKPDAED